MVGNNGLRKIQSHLGVKIMATSLYIMGNIHPNAHPHSESQMASYQRQYSTLSILIYHKRIETNKK